MKRIDASIVGEMRERIDVLSVATMRERIDVLSIATMRERIDVSAVRGDEKRDRSRIMIYRRAVWPRLRKRG